jgi:hypothetical protein
LIADKENGVEVTFHARLFKCTKLKMPSNIDREIPCSFLMASPRVSGVALIERHQLQQVLACNEVRPLT